MALYTRNMRQTATYFPPAGQDGFGNPLYGSPVPIVCRWQDKADLFRDTQGREVVSTAIVYVATDVEIAGRLALGTISDPDDAREIRQRGSSPALTRDVELIKVWL